ncbi:MAG: alpha/beta hydrolase [Bacteroidales bacterium]|nr:alpha/beta hydrolase [Bacteroidales bacterium]
MAALTFSCSPKLAPQGQTDARPEPVTLLLYPEGQAVDKGLAGGPLESNGLTGPETFRKDGFRYNVTDSASVTLYIPEVCNGQMVVVCPGGGYYGVAMVYEGYRVAEWMNARGIAACVVKYRMPNGHDRIPLQDVQNAFRYCRAHAAEWGVTKIGVMGFSAGGHLAATASNLFADKTTRPDFSILIYPVITMDPAVSHGGTRKNLLGAENFSEGDPRLDRLEDRYSMEKQVTVSTPPTFIALGADDKTVPPENSLRYFESLHAAGVPAELHIYPEGPHGFSFRRSDEHDPIAYCRPDFDAALTRWLEGLR